MQSVTTQHLAAFLDSAVALSESHRISVEAVIAAKHALELERQNNIAVAAGDYSDEHAAGIGEILHVIAGELNGRS